MAVLVEDRRKQVLELVKQRGFITLADLAREVAMSESTVRRDLDHWHARGLIKRIHGGAGVPGGRPRPPPPRSPAGRPGGGKRGAAPPAAGRPPQGAALPPPCRR